MTTLLAVYDGSGVLKQRFEYAAGRLPVRMVEGGAAYHLVYDQVGTLRAVVDGSGNVVKTVEYDSFGNVVDDSAPAVEVPFGFAGGLFDSDTGLTRFGFRNYDADVGRWTAKDPIQFAGGDTDLYGYCLGDPVGLVDVDGLFWREVWSGIKTGWSLFDHRTYEWAAGYYADKAYRTNNGFYDAIGYVMTLSSLSIPCPFELAAGYEFEISFQIFGLGAAYRTGSQCNNIGCINYETICGRVGAGVDFHAGVNLLSSLVNDTKSNIPGPSDGIAGGGGGGLFGTYASASGHLNSGGVSHSGVGRDVGIGFFIGGEGCYTWGEWVPHE